MRSPTVIANGRFLEGQPHEAETVLGHGVSSLREFAAALDAFDEASANLRQAHVVVGEEFTAAAVHSTEPNVVAVQASIFQATRYWGVRQLLLAKAAVIGLSQVRDTLLDFARLTNLQVASEACERFDLTFPHLQAMRDSVAHSSSRARWVADKGWHTAKGGGREKREIALVLSEEERGGVMNLSDLLARNGHVEGVTLVLRILHDGTPQMGRLELSDITLEAAREIIQAMVDKLAWRHSLNPPEPLAEWIA